MEIIKLNGEMEDGILQPLENMLNFHLIKKLHHFISLKHAKFFVSNNQ